ncbi:hypothetical protein [Agrobacterium tumefaciens]|uniref:Uncharacterized protein n=1 Tax=Agrobacterium tumefaciens TaxID=358 RepID=A0AA44F7L7_AGRTU|nr:hypothetical protein [Agrobacterium tumefaciens]NTB86381.1 hypothetical protein [Agrobacterium tumefaciens]NTC17397.1 hypothetical protein [Agrobacterium tumefaciens]NTC30258.1 hypothetical protein [Agrobacterium tumefaciens]
MSDIISLPSIGWRECSFDPVQPRSTARMEGRRTEAMAFGTPYWKANYKATYLSEEDFGKMDAFMMQAGDSGDVFLGYDVFRPRPIAMDTGAPLSGTKAAGGAFNGDAYLQAITGTTQLNVGGLPAAFKFLPGDYVELRMTTLKRSLHRVIAAATSNAGGFVTLSVRFPIDTQNFTSSAVVNFEKPSCTMQIDPESYSGSKSWSSREPSFSGTEVFIS